MKHVTVYETVGGPGLIVLKNSNKYQTWAGSDNVEIETVTTSISIDEIAVREQLFNDFTFRQKLETEIKQQMDMMLRLKLKELIRDTVKLDVIIWKDEDGEKFTAQVILDGDVCLEKTAQVAV